MNTWHRRNDSDDDQTAAAAGPASITARVAVLIVTILAAALAAASVPGPEREPVPVPTPEAPGRKPPPAPALAPERGRLLYENHCTTCHESVVHVRERRRAGSLAALESWVRHWSRELGLDWGDGEVGAVVEYLNRRFYKFDSRR